MKMKFRALLLLTLLCAILAHAANKNARSIVLLISLDGFRFDYAEKYNARNLIAFGKRGVHAKAMLPSFPTTTFPNHYTIATGLYPANHGIVENSFWDPDMKALFRFNDPKLAGNPKFWGGTPLWVLAEKQGVTAAAYFWPGTDYEISGKRPTYWYPFDGKTKKEIQINQVIDWLKLPETKRPNFMTVYFSDADHAGHDHGPDSDETRAAVLELDQALGSLFTQIKHLKVPVNIFVVSDHGMTNVEPMIDLGKLANFEGVQTAGSGTNFQVYSEDVRKLDEIYVALTRVPDPRFAVYRKADIPPRLHYANNSRIGDLVVLSQQRVIVGVVDPKRPPRTAPPMKGTHGFDLALVPEMRAIFYAAGPNLKTGVTIEEFENIHVYPLIAKLLRLQVRDTIDGDLNVLAPILK